ncbi:outer membrane protein assembly factor BamA [Sphingomonas sp. S1-29]|uniref:outer membrane protein assembly factor BamA n=1 Tax=Sphingomonas sp. S1-29 TaxID=2991074 RepID=UPI00223F90FF|nr:outer membrane protein assembly factor BamA [Sphingomonas sp. S1-29]UZK70972.1 outer membrane protein assembly factor BamA [Sphingomonas sp. S1-29]
MGSKYRAQAAAVLLAGTMLAGVAEAQTAPSTPVPTPGQAAPAPAPQVTTQGAPQTATPATVVAQPARTIRSLRVLGSQRIEPDTVLSYTKLRVGEPYTNETVDAAIKDLYASDLIAEAQIEGVESGDLIVRIRENPVINRVVLEGNRRLKSDKILPEIKLAPRQIFTRTAVRADVGRIVELYRRQGRFAAVVEPKQVVLDQNRVDVVFEIAEGPKSKVRQINILGNEQFSDNALRKEMATKQARFFRFFSSATSYDQDRLAYDQQKLRQYYLTEGYADFRVISAVAELTPDKEDFIITYVVEEGPRYKFGDVTVDSGIRDFNGEQLAKSLQIKKGEWFNAKLVEDSVTSLSEAAGLFGYAFADVRPEYQRDEETLTMGLTFNIAESQRTYVERIEITGNTQTQDEVIRREMRIAEGDAYNSFLRKRSQDRINSLGYFQDKFEIEEQPGSTPDRVILTSNVEERSTGELTLSAGFSSLERFILQGSIRQRNFRGKGQDLRLQVNYSSFSKSIEAGFTEPYLFDKNIALGGTVFRRDFSNFNFVGNERNTTYSQVSTGFNIVAGIPLTEYWSLSGRYNLQQDDVSLDEATFFSNGQCDPLRAGRFLCEQLGNRITSLVGASLVYDSLNSRLRPTAGQRLLIGADFAGLGGDVRYARARIDGIKYFNMGGGFILSAAAQGGYIKALEDSRGPGIDPVRIIDRFYLGEPQFRGFDIRGVGPRVQRIPFTTDEDGNTILVTDRDQIVDDAIGGKGYYLTKAEVEIPLGSGAQELGLRPSVYVMAGALFNVTRPLPTITFTQATDSSGNPVFNVDGSPSLLPATTPIRNSEGAPLYINTFTNNGVPSQRSTTCATGYAATVGAACVGTEQNSAAVNTTTPFLERFVGDSIKPRITVGIGVNWNSPFGPLRIDLAKDIISVDGDDPKLLTFNVGAGF